MLDAFKKPLHNNIIAPPFLYGTAWKEEETQSLTLQALQNGFVGIDTANQRKHYFEEGVGLGIQQFLKNSGKSRTDLFLQTKFTSIDGQDHRLPYDKSDTCYNQVKQSFESSLNHLQTDYIDSYVLHGPSYSVGLIPEDFEIWEAMEDLFQEGKVKSLGISNINLAQLEELCKVVSVKPSFVQNRCYASTQWDRQIRQFCEQHGIIYQGFSLLTANQLYLQSEFMQLLKQQYHKTIPQIIFRFALQKGMLPLTGTNNQHHMQEDLDIDSFELSLETLQLIEEISK